MGVLTALFPEPVPEPDGLTETVLGGSAGYLHDGRARTIEEAILWHDGEAAAASAAFREVSALERETLVRFLRSL